MQVIQLILFSTITIVTAAAGGYCLVQGINGFVKVRSAQNTEVKIGPYLFIKTPAPALVVCFFGLILFLIVPRLVEDKIKISKLNDTVSRQSSELAELQRKNEELFAELNATSAHIHQKAAADDPNKVNTKVTGVSASFFKEGTKEEPQMPRSEMGTLIARNHDEIDQLRRIGERDYFEFTIEEGKAQTVVGNVTVELKSINAKKRLFTIDVKADDKGFEKKNHSVNDPIFFYTTGIQSALELVINKLTKNQALGYLSVPRTRHRAI